MNPTPAPSGTSGAANPTSSRLNSLDALRGFDMFWIMGGDSLIKALNGLSEAPLVKALGQQLSHKDWEGFAFYDLIFPLFVFLVGVSIVFALTKQLETQGRGPTMVRVLKRGLLLFVLGLLYSGGFTRLWPEIRVLGVLNRIALCYTAAGLLFCLFKPRGLAVWLVGILAGYWALMTFVPVPGLGAGHFEKGANLSNYIDSQYLPGRLYDGTWDPEGLLSTLPAIGTCLLGVMCGLFIRRTDVSGQRKVATFIGGGAVLVLLGFLWGLQFPVIKKIWTSSYVLVAGGYSAMLLGAFYWIVDVQGRTTWCQPFVWIGLNPITIYIADNIIGFGRLAERFAGGDVKRILDATVTKGFGGVVIALVEILLAFLLARFLFQRRIFLRV